MDEYREFLEAQVKDSEGRNQDAFGAVKTALDAFDVSLDDVLTWRKALEKYTRTSGSPYLAPPLSNPLDALLAGRVAREEKREVQRERPKREEKPPVPHRFTKRGAVRAFILSLEKGMNVGEVFEALSKRELPEQITKDDLYRILPGLYARGEIGRENGKYGPPRLEGQATDGGFFDGIKEPVM